MGRWDPCLLPAVALPNRQWVFGLVAIGFGLVIPGVVVAVVVFAVLVVGDLWTVVSVLVVVYCYYLVVAAVVVVTRASS